MTEEAAGETKQTAPKLAVPVHYGAKADGNVVDARRFAALIERTGIIVKIKEKVA
jgi:L-ascorbate metabolism protein UlaG (beta-lactamase superfamily)